jgi:subtilisin-like proprotein convertase family protein
MHRVLLLVALMLWAAVASARPAIAADEGPCPEPDCNGNCIDDFFDVTVLRVFNQNEDPPLAIPDNTGVCITSTLAVVEPLTIYDLDIGVLIRHTWNGDLVVSMEHADTGTAITLIDRMGGGNASDDGLDVVLDDEAAAPIESATAGGGLVQDTYTPEQSLTAYDFESTLGTWVLTVCDNGSADTGVLENWSLRVRAPTAQATSRDCNEDLIPDECQLADNDCNGNEVPDDCDIEFGDSLDCNDNLIPDECEEDCNGNGVPDDCDLCENPVRGECSQDCNANGVPDECDIASGESEDCQPNGVPDECDLKDPDCEGADFRDECLIDCNGNAVPDDCDEDCNNNGTPDDCEELTDCNGNGTPDECEEFGDCNSNGVPDECDVAGGASADCQPNGIPDECDGGCPPPEQEQPMDDFVTDFNSNGNTAQGNPCGECGGLGVATYSLTILGYGGWVVSRRRRR